MSATFRWHDVRLPYWDADYNNTRNNERAVELTIVHHWLQTVATPPGVGLEVGNVLAHYQAPWVRRIVDLTEQAEGVENIDVRQVEGSYPWIVSISTVEHVGQPDYADVPEPMASTEAVLHLADLLAPGGRMLVTVPLGWNRDLDADLAMGAVGVARQCTLHRRRSRLGMPPTWVTAPEPVAPRPYNHQAQSADAVWIGEWVAPGLPAHLQARADEVAQAMAEHLSVSIEEAKALVARAGGLRPDAEG